MRWSWQEYEASVYDEAGETTFEFSQDVLRFWQLGCTMGALIDPTYVGLILLRRQHEIPTLFLIYAFGDPYNYRADFTFLPGKTPVLKYYKGMRLSREAVCARFVQGEFDHFPLHEAEVGQLLVYDDLARGEVDDKEGGRFIVNLGKAFCS